MLDDDTRDKLAIIVVTLLSITICLLILWHVVNNISLDPFDHTLVTAIIAIAAGLIGLQLPGIISARNTKLDKRNGNDPPKE